MNTDVRLLNAVHSGRAIKQDAIEKQTQAIHDYIDETIFEAITREEAKNGHSIWIYLDNMPAGSLINRLEIAADYVDDIEGLVVSYQGPTTIKITWPEI